MKTKMIYLVLALFLILRGEARAEELPQTATQAPTIQTDIAAVKQTEKPNILRERKKHNQLSRESFQVYTLSMRSNVIYEVQTAVGFHTTINLPETPLTVTGGDVELFKIEVLGNVIYVKPLTDEEGVETNLTVFTSKGHLSFHITVGPEETADYLLDFHYPGDDTFIENEIEARVGKVESKLKEEYEKKESSLDKKAKELSEVKLKEKVKDGNQVVKLGNIKNNGDVQVNLVSLSTIGDKSYLRFSVRNQSETAYKVREAALAIQTYKKKWFGLKKEKEGLREIASQLEIANPISQGAWQYGVIEFDKTAIKKEEKPVFFLFEEGGARHFKIESFEWLS